MSMHSSSLFTICKIKLVMSTEPNNIIIPLKLVMQSATVLLKCWHAHFLQLQRAMMELVIRMIMPDNPTSGCSSTSISSFPQRRAPRRYRGRNFPRSTWNSTRRGYIFSKTRWPVFQYCRIGRRRGSSCNYWRGWWFCRTRRSRNCVRSGCGTRRGNADPSWASWWSSTNKKRRERLICIVSQE